VAITRESLLSLEAYARARPQFRQRVLAHKARRRVVFGDHVILLFEDELTVRYQIQEMLRAERIFEEDAIQSELVVYSGLVPDGRNWKATMMIAYADPNERAAMLQKLIGIEDTVWIQVAGAAPVYAVADEDAERETEAKTSAVHFLRFDLDPAMIEAVKSGASLSAGIDHPHYRVRIDALESSVAAALAQDLHI
jgi:glycerol-3-phosphate dehydrogenase subunit C